MGIVQQNFAQIERAILTVLEENKQPMSLSALTQVVNTRCNNRLPYEVIERFLKGKPQLFGQTAKGLWGLQTWSPRVSYSQVEKIDVQSSQKHGTQAGLRAAPVPEPCPSSLHEVLQELLDNLTPNTDDKPSLNEISCYELEQATYRPGILVSETSDANMIVPQKLYLDKRQQSWRYPPIMKTTFFAKCSNSNSFILSIELLFGLGSVLKYQDEQEDLRGQIRLADRGEQPNLVLGVPLGFSKGWLNGMNYDLRPSGQSTGYVRLSGPLRFYRFAVREDITGNVCKHYANIEVKAPDNVFVKVYDQLSPPAQRVTALDIVDVYQPRGLPHPDKTAQPRMAAITLQLAEVNMQLTLNVEYLRAPDAYQVTIELSNQSEGTRYPILHSLVIPYLRIGLERATPIMPEQQHTQRLAEAAAGKEQPPAFDLLRPSQTNCILTRSTKDPQVLYATTFGVYDTIRTAPVSGPKVSDLTKDIEGFLVHAKVLSEKAKFAIRANPKWKTTLPKVMKAIERSFRGISSLHLYQWEAIQHRLEALCQQNTKTVSVINAPTGTGKTLVFFVNAALHYLFTGERVVLIFPTRILNEDMFKRLTSFVHALRQELPEEYITGGIFIGSSDPSYNAIMNPAVGALMVQYEDKDGSCPQCRDGGRSGKIRCQERNGRRIGVCEECGHEIDYMYTPRPAAKVAEVCAYLPSLVIATPDKLFYEATVAAPHRVLPFFGAPALRCSCGFHNSLLYKDAQVSDSIQCKACGKTLDKTLLKPVLSPLAYFVFDEVHSLHGVTATLLSYFFNLLREMTKEFDCPVQGMFETGTATIANEQELVETLTRQTEVEMFPPRQRFLDYFRVEPRRVRYRTLIFMPVGTATVRSLSNAIIYTYEGLHDNQRLKKALGRDAYDFLLAYIPRKEDGYAITNSIRRYMTEKSYFPAESAIRFLSGDSRAATMARILSDVLEKNTNLLTANMVVSLGLDIPRLNNMLMMGVPQSMTEMVQTAGRTGRTDAPGHVTIHLLPANPRNEFVFRNFHQVLGDVEGYFDAKPVAPVNPYVADLILNNAVIALLSARIAQDYQNAFCNRAGAWLKANWQPFLDRLIGGVLALRADKALQAEVAKAILGRYRTIVNNLGNEDGQLWQWIKAQPDTLFTLRARADWVGVQIDEQRLLDLMKREDLPRRVVDDDAFVDANET